MKHLPRAPRLEGVAARRDGRLGATVAIYRVQSRDLSGSEQGDGGAVCAGYRCEFSIQAVPVEPLVPAPMPAPRMLLPLSRLTVLKPPLPEVQLELGPATPPGPALVRLEAVS